MNEAFGLYIHIPFCSAVCHYCDFAKTAFYTSENIADYFKKLGMELASKLDGSTRPLTSVFLGGGTPGLFTREYDAIFANINARLAKNAEVSLEANPNNISDAVVKYWKDLGVNRLSIGVQTFDDVGLKFLTRDHVGAQVLSAIDTAKKSIPNINIDLIYGWPGQTLESWRRDLTLAVNSGVTHLSLYCLTYEPETTLGRKLRRGLVRRVVDERLADYYALACDFLGESGFNHEEVSNWSRPGSSCAHNWLYWSDGEFIGVGCGAHGYTKEPLPGERYANVKDFRRYLRGDASEVEARTVDDWLLEYVGSSLRTEAGTDLNYIFSKTALKIKPNGIVKRGIDEGLVTIGSHFKLIPAEWFRENAWGLALVECLSK